MLRSSQRSRSWALSSSLALVRPASIPVIAGASASCRAVAQIHGRQAQPQPQPQPQPQLRSHHTRTLRGLHTYGQHPTLRGPASSDSSTSTSTSTSSSSGTGPLLSRVSGPTTPPLCELSLGDFWDTLVQRYEDRSALVVRHEPASQHSLGGAGAGAGAGAEGDECVRWNYGQMDEHIRRLANGLWELGVRKGDRVAVLMMNNSAYAALQWASTKLGAVLVTLNPSYRPQELKNALKHVGASTLILVPSLRSSDYISTIHFLLPSLSSRASPSGDPTLLCDEALPDLKRLIVVDNLTSRPRGWESSSALACQGVGFEQVMRKLEGRAVDYRELLRTGAARTGRAEESVSNTDMINLQLTSGTTGAPKAVALTSRNLLNNGIAIGDGLRFTSKDILCNVPPLFHCFGLVLGNLAAWTHGASVVYAAEGFDPVRALRATSEERCTALHGVPTHFISELEVLDQIQAHASSPSSVPLPPGARSGETFDFTPLRTGLTSGSTVPIELMHRIMDPRKLGAKEQTVVYGMTESSPVSFQCALDAPIDKRCETVGKVSAHTHAKIVAPEDRDGKPLPVGQPGEVCVAGYLVFQGYWKNQQKTDEVLERHPDEPDITWLRTGDMGTMDEEGYVRIVGRSKDIIIRGGENVFPVSIENSIDEMDGVATSAVIAVPDAKYGETVGVFIGRSHTGSAAKPLIPASVRSHVRESMSGQSAPEWVWFLGEDGIEKEMPKTASGKIQKVVLRKWAKELAEKGIGKANVCTAKNASSSA